jgi:hypothetical protein
MSLLSSATPTVSEKAAVQQIYSHHHLSQQMQVTLLYKTDDTPPENSRKHQKIVESTNEFM